MLWLIVCRVRETRQQYLKSKIRASVKLIPKPSDLNKLISDYFPKEVVLVVVCQEY